MRVPYFDLTTQYAALRGVPTGRGLFWWGAFFLDGTDCHRVHALLDDEGDPVPAFAVLGDR